MHGYKLHPQPTPTSLKYRKIPSLQARLRKGNFGLARENRDRIVAVLVRNVTGEGADAVRYVQAMRDLPRKVWTVFDEPNQLPGRWF
jgi:hypothetical protein